LGGLACRTALRQAVNRPSKSASEGGIKALFAAGTACPSPRLSRHRIGPNRVGAADRFSAREIRERGAKRPPKVLGLSGTIREPTTPFHTVCGRGASTSGIVGQAESVKRENHDRSTFRATAEVAGPGIRRADARGRLEIARAYVASDYPAHWRKLGDRAASSDTHRFATAEFDSLYQLSRRSNSIDDLYVALNLLKAQPARHRRLKKLHASLLALLTGLGLELEGALLLELGSPVESGLDHAAGDPKTGSLYRATKREADHGRAMAMRAIGEFNRELATLTVRHPDIFPVGDANLLKECWVSRA
jgi:hypothetical protein